MLTQELLLSVSKPGRYTGGEINAVKKDLSAMAAAVCLCFPDTYEIGMSHLGLRILYDLINRQGDCAAERVFAPWVDMEEKLRARQIPLFSLESRRPVKDFDVLGFSLNYELSYTNVLNILSLSGIPLRGEDRQDGHPLVIAGGGCCLNPGPMSDFIDCFIVGEAEELILEFLEVYKDYKARGAKDKAALLKRLSLIEGVYVPPGQGAGARPLKVSRRFIKDLDAALDLKYWIVPYIEIVHDRLGIEIMRGCPNSCRFCQARAAFYPLRAAGEEKIIAAARRLMSLTGYEELSLLSLSSSDHPALESLVSKLTAEFGPKGVNVALPSLRAKNLLGGLRARQACLSGRQAGANKGALTLAPEAGSERLRQLLRKNIVIDEFYEVCRQAYASGYRHLKLYFMIGLPTETSRDLDEIHSLCLRVSALKRSIDGRAGRLNVSVSNFIPKPHTVFQWQAAAGADELAAKQEYLGGLFRSQRGVIKLKFHDARMSWLEAMLSRGDRRLGRVIEAAFLAGAKFDAWQNMFNASLWQKALVAEGIDPRDYLAAGIPGCALSWDFIDTGIPKESLVREAQSIGQ